MDSAQFNPGLAQLQLLRLSCPSLPVGGFAYSQGLEFAIEEGWVSNPEQLRGWLQGVLTEGLAQLDLPILARLYHAWQQGDYHEFERWNLRLIASRETAELELEDLQMGRALRELLRSVAPTTFDKLPSEDYSWTAVFAAAGCHWQIPLDALTDGYLWSWLENQLTVAGKTLPLGQTACQLLLNDLLPLLPQARQQGLSLNDSQIAGSLPALSMASSLHETQYCRLFRS
ncbi:urease accessory protein UreF [Aliagarivorans taiwanensis]|uniref:urease accessory protein UreF n=1 Tax=Aliagarivorans taiwanensis TaxID=561966 RepID=UPI000405EFE2|nr:urease accessory UreF family protein [Aliagarivorans taiwanensis]